MTQATSTAQPRSYVIAAAILGAGALCAALIISAPANGAPNTQLKSVPSEHFAAYLQSETPTIIDVRTPEEFEAGHLPGAINIDYYDPAFSQKLAQLDPRGEYAIYCRSGNRSSDTLGIMRELGFHDVRDLSGGIRSWVAAGRDACTNC